MIGKDRIMIVSLLEKLDVNSLCFHLDAFVIVFLVLLIFSRALLQAEAISMAIVRATIISLPEK